ncbi:hypothetical protein [Actinomadura macrotermitis]|uniref:Uncharacterized protein n=1 Tax=Actinomadura macrotermitis TaxID=2585200 RepID=A0A7K0BTC0_9ACTN|nr:hypothetical protein [Actinomadura macrotermitis]MQY04142.1 hypothetical protein [Actinomadura macrotermitis]
MSTALESLEMTPDDVRDLIGQLEEESPAVAHLMTAFADLADALESEELLDGVYEQTADMRRPHLRVLVALTGHALERLSAGLNAVELETRVPAGAEALEPWESAVETAGQVLESLAEDLARRGERDREN